MDALLQVLSTSPLLLLFLVVGLGFLLGTVRIAGFSLGPAAVLFSGILFGALDSRLRIPDLVYVFGLVMFVYTIGLQSGPTFFASFGRRALRTNLFAMVMLLVAAAISYAAWYIGGFNGAAVTGMFCGSLTNTPALAASIEVIKRSTLGLSGTDVNAPVIGYSVSYPFGVIGVLLGFYFFGRKKNVAGAGEDDSSQGSRPDLSSQTFVVTNPAAIAVPVSALLSLPENHGFLLSRMRRGDETTLVYGETTFEKGDLVVAVGTHVSLDAAQTLLGETSAREIQNENQGFDFRRIEVSDPKVVGRRIADLNIQEMLDATITRIRRGDTDFVPTGETILERGDRVRVLTWAGNIERLCRFFGDSVKLSSETDFLSLSIGLMIGVLIGMVPIPLPGGSTFTLGFAGGPLLAGLILGWIKRSGSIIWGMPYGVNLTLRQLGLVLFLAGIGTKAGDGFVHTVLHGGWALMAIGALVTITVTSLTMILGMRLLGISLPAAMGLMSGIQTQPACLAYANEHSGGNAPNVWYASVYPASMIAKIIIAQLLVSWMVR